MASRKGPRRWCTERRRPRRRRSTAPKRSLTRSSIGPTKRSDGQARAPPGGRPRLHRTLVDAVLPEVGAHVVAFHAALACHLAHVALAPLRQGGEVLPLEHRDGRPLRVAEPGLPVAERPRSEER